MPSAEVQRVKDAFADYDCDDESVWDSAAALAQFLHMSPAEISEQYELFAIKTCALHPFPVAVRRRIAVQRCAGAGQARADGTACESQRTCAMRFEHNFELQHIRQPDTTSPRAQRLSA